MDSIMNQKKASFATTKDTSDISTSASGTTGTTVSILIFLFGLLLGFLFVWCFYCYCERHGISTMKAISYGKISQDSNNMRQKQENNEMFSEPLPIQNNSPDSFSRVATSDRPASPRTTYLTVSGAAFLPHPNTGIAYQAPSTNPV